jgi:hypothetical protein
MQAFKTRMGFDGFFLSDGRSSAAQAIRGERHGLKSQHDIPFFTKYKFILFLHYFQFLA